MVEKLSSVKIISAAPLATSVPVFPMAQPMSAAFRAGASLTPSPVMATTFPRFCHAWTIRILCSGDTRANTANFSMSSSSTSWGIKSSSAPVTDQSPGRAISSSLATAMAVARWSPVIITGRTPAIWHLATAARTSGRGGSIRPNRPRKVSPLSTIRGSRSAGRLRSSRRATAITRRARFAISSLAASTRARSAWVMGPLGVLEHRSSSTSGAPFTMAVQPPPGSVCTVVISFRLESNGMSATRRQHSNSRFWSTPSRAAATTSAPSVGSPEAAGAPAFQLSRASEHKHPASIASRRRAPGVSHTCCTVILFWVRVPVLSEQITPAQPRVSTAGSFFTMAFRAASL